MEPGKRRRGPFAGSGQARREQVEGWIDDDRPIQGFQVWAISVDLSGKPQKEGVPVHITNMTRSLN